MFFSATSTKVHLFLWLCFTLRPCTNNTFPSSRKNMHDVTSSLKQVDSMKSLPSQKRHKAHYTIFYYLNWRHFTTDSDDDDDDDDCKTQLNCLSLCTDNLPVAQQLYHELHFWLCTLKGPVLSQVMNVPSQVCTNSRYAQLYTTYTCMAASVFNTPSRHTHVLDTSTTKCWNATVLTFTISAN